MLPLAQPRMDAPGGDRDGVTDSSTYQAMRLAMCLAAALQAILAPVAADARLLFNDSHFHLTNYIQEGPPLREFLGTMGDAAGRVALFGIPLQQTWSYENSGDYAPKYYLQTDAPLYYYSFTDAYIAATYLSLTADERARRPFCSVRMQWLRRISSSTSRSTSCTSRSGSSSSRELVIRSGNSTTSGSSMRPA